MYGRRKRCSVDIILRLGGWKKVTEERGIGVYEICFLYRTSVALKVIRKESLSGTGQALLISKQGAFRFSNYYVEDV